MNFKFTRFLSLIVVMFTMFSMSALAGSNKDYYSKITAKSVGEGKVYVKYNEPVEEDDRNYLTESSDQSGADNQGSAPTHVYYLYAQASENYKFAGWYSNQDCSGNPLSADNPYIATIEAKTNVASATKTYYAKFEYVDPTVPYFEFNQEHIYVNIDASPAVPEGMLVKNVVANYVSSNKAVVEIDNEGKLTPKAAGTARITITADGYDDLTSLVTVINNVEAGKTQIGNSDFEDWRGVTDSNHAPYNWNSFETAEGSWASTAKAVQVAMVEDHRPGSNGLYCVDIYSRVPIGTIVAQGTITTGCLNAGATTATAKENNSFSKTTDKNKSETISRVPSAIKMWVKFVPKDNNSKGLVTATVHDAHNYVTYSKDEYDDDDNRSYAIAKAKSDIVACAEWAELTIPFELTDNTTDGQMYILLNIATNNTPGGGSQGDHLYVDDIELVYPEPETVVYDKYIGITVNGAQLEPVAAPIEVTDNKNGTIDFNLKNFSMDLGGTPADVGNITLPGLAIDEDGHFSFEGNILITAGDKEGVTTWMGPMVGEIPVVLDGTIKDDYFYVHIDISIPGQDVVVEAGDLASATVSVSDALITTFCAPFTVAIPSDYQDYVTINKITGANGNVLTLEPVENYVIPANTPVVVQIPMAYELPVSGIYVKGTPTPNAGLLTGVYENTHAPVGSYVLQNNDGKVGFYKVASGKQPTVTANHCYLTAPASNIKAFYFNEEDATGIENVNVNANEGAIYNVAGQRISKIQKGINIINGKKILK